MPMGKRGMKCRICRRVLYNDNNDCVCQRCLRILKKIPVVFREYLSWENKLEKDKSYYFYGPSGVFKSQRAANMLITRGGGRWENVPRLLHKIRTSFNNKSEEVVDYVKELSETPWLCLDDLGVDKRTDWVVQTLYLIVNNRYENILPIVITSNLPLEDLAERLGDDRLASRIAGMCEVIKMEGEDRRMKK